MEEQIIYQCSPVLLDIKISNLLIVDVTYWDKINKLFFSSEISVEKLETRNQKIVVYLYRKKELKTYLLSKKVQFFLKEKGYLGETVEEFIEQLKKQYISYDTKNREFPHEFGIFLGYPIDDVEGFIKNKGANYIYSGYWKVYNETFHQNILFSSYQKARCLLLDIINKGITLEQILSI